MQLRRVRVRNIRSYEHAQVRFPAGTTLLWGDVGAGKTSLLYAIEMALFGVAEVDAAYLVRHGASHAEVEVEFEDAAHRYTIERKFRWVRRKGKPGFEPEGLAFSADGAKTHYSATELRQRVIELLGFPDNPNPQAHSDLWRWAVYVPQERMRDILSARPQDRLETVRKALGVERYRTAAENAQDLAGDLKASAARRRGEADRLRHHDLELAEWTAESDRLAVDRATLVASLAERARDVARAEEAVAALLDAERRVAADRRLLEGLEREEESDRRAATLRQRARAERAEERARWEREAERSRPAAALLDERRRRLAEAESVQRAHREALDRHAERIRALERARAELASAERRATDADATKERVERDAAEARATRDALRAEGPSRAPPAPTPATLAELEAALEEARAREAEALADATRAREALAGIDELLRVGRCPTCGQAVVASDFAAHRSEAAARAESADAAHRDASARRGVLDETRRARERFERALERFREVEKRRALAEGAVAKAEAVTAAAETARSAARAALEEARARTVALAPEEAEESRLREALASAVRQRDAIAEEERQSGQAARDLASATSASQALRAELERIDRDVAQQAERSEERRRRLEELRRGLESAGATARDLAEAKARRATAVEREREEKERLVRTDARLDEAARRRRDAEKGRDERATLLTEADDLRQKAEWVAGPFRKAVLTMEQRLLANAQAAFERNFARYFASLVDDPGLLARTDVAFTPGATIHGEWTPAEALSGGERTSLALAFRLALAQVVRSLGSLRLDTILLDEPTDGFSPEQVVRMGELLDELGLPQVILVSHEDQLAAVADRVVRIVKRDGRSTAEGAREAEAVAGAPDEERGPAPETRRRGRRSRGATLSEAPD